MFSQYPGANNEFQFILGKPLLESTLYRILHFRFPVWGHKFPKASLHAKHWGPLLAPFWDWMVRPTKSFQLGNKVKNVNPPSAGTCNLVAPCLSSAWCQQNAAPLWNPRRFGMVSCLHYFPFSTRPSGPKIIQQPKVSLKTSHASLGFRHRSGASTSKIRKPQML